MLSDNYLKDYLEELVNKEFAKYSKTIKYQVLDSLQTAFYHNLPLEQIPEKVISDLNIIGSKDEYRELTKSIVRQYVVKKKVITSINPRKIIKAINEIINEVKRDLSNTAYFGLDKIRYSYEEIDILKDLYVALCNVREKFNPRKKLPECNNDCENCIVNGRAGCKIMNNPTRAINWGIHVEM